MTCRAGWTPRSIPRLEEDGNVTAGRGLQCFRSFNRPKNALFRKNVAIDGRKIGRDVPIDGRQIGWLDSKEHAAVGGRRKRDCGVGSITFWTIQWTKNAPFREKKR